MGSNQKAGHQHGRKDRSHVSSLARITSCENPDTRKYKTDG
jgi:hypothetical protein